LRFGIRHRCEGSGGAWRDRRAPACVGSSGARAWGVSVIASAFGLLIAFALILSLGCGREAKRKSTEAQGEGAAAKPPTLIVAVPYEPDQLLPPLSRSPASAALWGWVFPSLVRVEADSTMRGRFTGDLAASWQLDDDRKGIRFFLASDRLWDDTTAVGPSDVVTAYHLFVDPKIAGSWGRRLDEILSIEAPGANPGMVLFRFRHPIALARALQLATLPVISSAQWAKSVGLHPPLGTAGRIPRTAGPFRIDEWKPGDSIRLTRHPFPPAGRIPRAERVLIRFVPSGESRGLQVEHGAADIAIDIPSEEAKRLREEEPQIRLERSGPIEVEALVWNLDHPIWGRWDLRRDVAMHLDMDRLRHAAAGDWEDAPVLGATGIFEARKGTRAAPLRTVNSGAAVAASGSAALDSGAAVVESEPTVADSQAATVRSRVAAIEPVGSSEPSGSSKPSEPAPALADSLPAFSFAAYGNPPIEILYETANARRERIAVEVAVQLDRLGLSTRLSPQSAEECAARIRERRFEAVVTGYTIPAIHDVGEIWQSGGALNLAGLRAAGVDSLVALARSAAADTIPDAWDRVEQRVHTYYPFIPIDRRVRVDGVGPSALGWRADAYDPYGDLLSLEHSPR
jgi:ABC-type transport system substrate-binding protein